MMRGSTIPARSAKDASIWALMTNRFGRDVSSRLNGGLTTTAADSVNAPNMNTTNPATAAAGAAATIVNASVKTRVKVHFKTFAEIFRQERPEKENITHPN